LCNIGVNVATLLPPDAFAAFPRLGSSGFVAAGRHSDSFDHREVDPLTITIRDVADAAGVSPSTASRAMRGSSRISAETRNRVVAAASELGYAPNRAARALKTGRRSTIGLVVPDILNPFFGELMKGAQEVARSHDLALLTADCDEDPRIEAAALARMRDDLDGLLVSVTPDRDVESVLSNLRESPVPVVLLNRRAEGLCSAVVDTAPATKHLVTHLSSLGHRAVAWTGGHELSWSDARQRELLRAECDATGLEFIDVGRYPTNVNGGIAAADAVTASGATAVIGFNDQVAVGLLLGLSKRGLSVPGDISVVGIDDIDLARYVTPTLTTIDMNTRRLGAQATHLLVEILDGKASTSQGVAVTAALKVRDSTGPAPRR
jgi:LacI family transcriptional regulator/LacI family repressor for deo operon, udp, cdd, tsx, nupC, and nupG